MGGGLRGGVGDRSEVGYAAGELLVSVFVGLFGAGEGDTAVGVGGAREGTGGAAEDSETWGGGLALEGNRGYLGGIGERVCGELRGRGGLGRGRLGDRFEEWI